MNIREEADAVVIEIADNGPGIPAQYGTAVFDSYFRIPTGNQHNVKGYGLGLSYSRQAVERMGGSIHVEDCGGGGCRFVVRFPKAGT
jgi:two-component system phosphate regulon sensor histidine kinase PhoR